MSEETSEEMIPEEIAVLIVKYKDGSLTRGGRASLYEFLYERKQDPEWNLKEFVSSPPYNFDSTTYKRLTTAVSSFGKKKDRKPSATKKAEREVEKGATEKLLGDVKKIGEKIVTDYGPLAVQRGMPLDKLIDESVHFYMEYGDEIEVLVARLQQYQALFEVFREALRARFMRASAMRIHYDFILKLIRLQAMGADLPPEVIEQMEKASTDFMNQMLFKEAEALRTPSSLPTFRT